MFIETLDKFDEILASNKYKSSTTIINKLQEECDDFFNLEELVWLKNEAETQLENELTIRLFAEKEELKK